MKQWECTVCGYIHTGEEPPDECPVCAADKSMFVEVTEAATQAETAAGSKPATASGPGSASAGSLPSALSRAMDLAANLTVKHHLHPIMVHTPNGIVPMAVVFFLITALLGFSLFELAAFYSLVFVLLAMPLVLLTGYIMWQERYRGAMTSVFKTKIAASAVAVGLLLILTIWRTVEPTVVLAHSGGRWLYLLLAGVLVAAVGLAGHLGGTLVFGNRK